MKFRLPRLRKKALLLTGIVLAILIIALTSWFFVIPHASGFGHLFDKKSAAVLVTYPGNPTELFGTAIVQPLVADASAFPGAANDPLSVQFFDLSRGSPDTWSWDFGDTSASSDPDPVHTYPKSGVYTAALTIGRSDGVQRTFVIHDVLGVSSGTPVKVLADTLREGTLWKGSSLFAVPADSNSSVIIGTTSYALPAGSLVKIRADSDTPGTVTLRHGNILGCSLSDATLFINGTQAAKGAVSSCYIPDVRYYHANFTFSLLPTKGDVRQLLINGSLVRAGVENSRLVISQDTTSSESDLTLVTQPAYYEGSASQVTLSPAVIADFTAISPLTGSAPLNVSFMDTSAGSPVSWTWDFGDGAVSNEKNPTHLYASPGTYTVSLTVRNGELIDTKIHPDSVIATPPRVSANFTARPIRGPAPLTVRFTDASTGSPWSWNWTFGANTTTGTSTDQNPLVTYTEEGTYNVWLYVNNVYGSSDLLRPDYIVVTAPYRIPDKDILVRTGKSGYIQQDSSVQFIVDGTPATITINGAYRELPAGAVIRIVANTDQKADITIDSRRILKLGMPDVSVYVDGDLFAVGKIDSIYIPYMKNFRTDLTYYLPPQSAWTYVVINNYEVLSDLDNAWIRVYNLGMNEQGSLSLISTGNSTYIDGATNQTVQDWVIK